MPSRRTTKEDSPRSSLLSRLLSSTQTVRLRPAPEQLVLPLSASPRLRLAGRLLAAGVLLHVLGLLLTGHWLAAVVSTSVTACIGWRLHRRAAATPQRLVLEASGRLFLCAGEHQRSEVQLRPQSLRLGSHLLLVLSSGARTHRLLLGPDNLTAHELAALKCRLPIGPAPAGTALHSPAAPSRSDPP